MELSGGGSFLGMVFPVISPEVKNAIIKAALDGGINWFDTAEMYGGGVSERSVATGLKAAGKTDKDVVIATKWFPLFRTAGNIPQNDRRTACITWMGSASAITWSTSPTACLPRKPR